MCVCVWVCVCVCVCVCEARFLGLNPGEVDFALSVHWKALLTPLTKIVVNVATIIAPVIFYSVDF